MLKLCVGVETPQALVKLQKGRKELFHITRHFPKRAEELLDGGSLYWIFSGFIRARQEIVALEEVFEEQVFENKSEKGEQLKKCKIVLGQKLVLTESRPHRPFQGWRYFDNPPLDLKPENMPAELIKALGLD